MMEKSRKKEIIMVAISILSLAFAGFQFLAAKRANNIAEKALLQADIQSKKTDSLSSIAISEAKRSNDLQQQVNNLSQPYLEFQYMTITDAETIKEFLFGRIDEQYKDFFGIHGNNTYVPTEPAKVFTSLFDEISSEEFSKRAAIVLQKYNNFDNYAIRQLISDGSFTSRLKHDSEITVLVIRNTGNSPARNVNFFVKEHFNGKEKSLMLPMVRGGSIPPKSGVIIVLSLYNYNLPRPSGTRVGDGVILSPYIKLHKVEYESLGGLKSVKVRDRYEAGKATLRLGRVTAQCPFVFTGLGKDFNEGPFLINVNSIEKKRTIKKRLYKFTNQVRVYELEPEVSHIDMIKIIICRGKRTITLTPAISELKKVDDNSIVLNQDEYIDVKFVENYVPDPIDKVFLVSNGYYIANENYE